MLMAVVVVLTLEDWHNVGTEKRREKVIVLRELQRAIIYTRELSKQAIEGHVSTAFIVYSVNEGARLTHNMMHSWAVVADRYIEVLVLAGTYTIEGRLAPEEVHIHVAYISAVG
jgi:hypothetical protein